MNHKLEATRSEDRLNAYGDIVDGQSERVLSQSMSSVNEMSQLLRMRKKRRLPPVLVRRKPVHLQTFWPTYRGAVEWLRKRQNDLNIAIGLLDLYPNLIQESPLDGLWEFIRPLIPQTTREEGISKKNGYMSNSKTGFVDKEGKSSNSEIPTISITEVSPGDKDSSVSTDCKLVYVCGIHDRRSFRASQSRSLVSVLVEELSPVVYTKASPCSKDNANERNVTGTISESNALVFIMSKETISDPFCVNQLRLAALCDIPIVYVRQPGFTLPNPLPECLFDKAWSSGTEYGIRSFVPSRARSVSPAAMDTIDSKQEERIPRPPPVINPTRVYSGRLTKKRSNDKSNSIAMQIIDGYRTSLLYSDDFHGSFVQELYEKMSTVLGTTFPQAADTLRLPRRVSSKATSQTTMSGNGEKSTLSVNLRVPSPDGQYTGKEGKDEDGKDDGSYDEGLGQVFVDDLDNDEDWMIPEIDSGVSSPLEKETMYIIYPSPQPGGPTGEGPKVVKWPPKPGEETAEEMEDDSDGEFYPYIDSPFGFEDVNLTATVDSGSDTFGDM